MALLSAPVPGPQRLLTGESLRVSVRPAPGVDVSWWLDGDHLTDGDTFRKSNVQTDDSGTYVVLATRGTDKELHAVNVTVAPVGRSISVELPRTWNRATVTAVVVLMLLGSVAVAGPPVARALSLSQFDDGRPDAALIALVATAVGGVLLVTGAFVGILTAVSRAQSGEPDKVVADGVDPATAAKVVASLDRPRLAAALLCAGLLLLALAATLAWRLAGARPPADKEAVDVPPLAEMRETNNEVAALAAAGIGATLWPGSSSQ